MLRRRRKHNSSISGIVLMRMRYLPIVILALPYFVGVSSAQNQSSPTESGRKVIRRVEPPYPAVAKKMSLGGTVKIIAVVAPDGSVKKVELVGGSPLLVDAAQSAIAQWKYAPGT